jgi:uncharacterized protein (DUF2336 family)
MAAQGCAMLIAELEGAIQSGAPERRIAMLKRLTDLLVSEASRLTEQHLDVFDDVMVRLVDRVEASVLSPFSAAIANLHAAPRETVRHLAHHQDAKVAAPVLTRSSGLSEKDLIEVAKARSQDHLLAIASRAALKEAVTDVLIGKGDPKVARTLAGNSGAVFSQGGYTRLVRDAEHNAGLAETLASRRDMSVQMLSHLLARAPESVRTRLMQTAPPELRSRLHDVEGRAAGDPGKTAAPQSLNCAKAQATVLALNNVGKLKDSTINHFAIEKQHANTVAAIALLSSVAVEAIERLFQRQKIEGLVIACRAANLSWQTTMMIVRSRSDDFTISKPELTAGQTTFDTLSLSIAQRAIRTWAAQSAGRKPTRAVPDIVEVKNDLLSVCSGVA